MNKEETTPELIEEFEDSTGLTFDPNGPRFFRCEHCDRLIQFVPDHSCAGSDAENAAANWFNEAAYGRDI